jgi:NTP pyrophosphatase (non-canonical NTP hydrolase)
MEFQKLVEGYNSPLPADEPTKFMYHMAAIQEELGEVLKADKRWKTHRNDTYDRPEKISELADVYITIFNQTIWSGITAEEIMQAIHDKISENFDRINRGRLFIRGK